MEDPGADGSDASSARDGDRTGGPSPVLDRGPGSGSLSRAAHQRDVHVRRWGVLTPSATVIGRASSPDADVSDGIRRLHEEQHTATGGHSLRAHRLDRLRTTHALCNALDVTPWQRDIALGIMDTIDLTAFGSQRGVATVALVVIRHVVDVDRRRYLGLDDLEPDAVSTERLESLFEAYKEHDITSDDTFEELAASHGLDITSLNRLRRTLRNQIDDERLPAFGRNPYRDPYLPQLADGGGRSDTGQT